MAQSTVSTGSAASSGSRTYVDPSQPGASRARSRMVAPTTAAGSQLGRRTRAASPTGETVRPRRTGSPGGQGAEPSEAAARVTDWTMGIEPAASTGGGEAREFEAFGYPHLAEADATALGPLTQDNPPSTAAKARTVASAAAWVLPNALFGGALGGLYGAFQGLTRPTQCLFVDNLVDGAFRGLAGSVLGSGKGVHGTFVNARRLMGAYSVTNEGLSIRRDALPTLQAGVEAIKARGRVRTDAMTGHDMVIVTLGDLPASESVLHRDLFDEHGERAVDVTALIDAARARSTSVRGRYVEGLRILVKPGAQALPARSSSDVPRLVQAQRGVIERGRTTIRIPTECQSEDAAALVGLQLIHTLDRVINGGAVDRPGSA